MLVTQTQAVVITPSAACTLWDFAFPSTQLGLAHSVIHGRYPETGRVVNRTCDKAYFVISGRARIHYELGEFEIREGDAFLFEHGRWHWLEADHLHAVVVHAPPWNAEQHSIVP